MNDANFVCTGSSFVSSAFSSILGSAPISDGNDRLEPLKEKARRLLIQTGWIDIPLIMKHLNVDAQTAFSILKSLRDSGEIVRDGNL